MRRWKEDDLQLQQTLAPLWPWLSTLLQASALYDLEPFLSAAQNNQPHNLTAGHSHPDSPAVAAAAADSRSTKLLF